MAKLGSFSTAACAALVAVVAFAGCGTRRPPPAGNSTYEPPPTGGGGGFGRDAGAPPLPECGEQDDGSYCDCVDASLLVDPPNLYFVLDRSGSMAAGDKWDQVRITIAKLMRAIGPRASFGATVFPGFGNEACSPPVEVMSTRPGDPPSAEADGPTTKLLLTVTAGRPFGGTPTAQALSSALPVLEALPGKTFVILATDGGPNCNAQAGCDVSQCQPNLEGVPGCPPGGPENCCAPPIGSSESCLDGQRTLDAVAALRTAGLPTFVIGIPGSATYGALLDSLAIAGGTAQTGSPKYYRVDAAGSDALLATLKKVAAKIVATCVFKLKEPPLDPNAVNVYLDEVVVPKDPAEGWKLEGDTVTLLGGTCDRVLAGDVLDVRIIVGCPTVGPR